jgi:hypothetical protein
LPSIVKFYVNKVVEYSKPQISDQLSVEVSVPPNGRRPSFSEFEEVHNVVEENDSAAVVFSVQPRTVPVLQQPITATYASTVAAFVFINHGWHYLTSGHYIACGTGWTVRCGDGALVHDSSVVGVFPSYLKEKKWFTAYVNKAAPHNFEIDVQREAPAAAVADCASVSFGSDARFQEPNGVDVWQTVASRSDTECAWPHNDAILCDVSLSGSDITLSVCGVGYRSRLYVDDHDNTKHVIVEPLYLATQTRGSRLSHGSSGRSVCAPNGDFHSLYTGATVSGDYSVLTPVNFVRAQLAQLHHVAANEIIFCKQIREKSVNNEDVRFVEDAVDLSSSSASSDVQNDKGCCVLC